MYTPLRVRQNMTTLNRNLKKQTSFVSTVILEQMVADNILTLLSLTIHQRLPEVFSKFIGFRQKNSTYLKRFPVLCVFRRFGHVFLFHSFHRGPKEGEPGKRPLGYGWGVPGCFDPRPGCCCFLRPEEAGPNAFSGSFLESRFQIPESLELSVIGEMGMGPRGNAVWFSFLGVLAEGRKGAGASLSLAWTFQSSRFSRLKL